MNAYSFCIILKSKKIVSRTILSQGPSEYLAGEQSAEMG